MRRYQQPGVSVAAPSRPIERGLPIPSLLAQVIGANYADLCPLTARDQLIMRRAFIAFAIAGLLALFLMVEVSADTAWLATALNASHGLIFAVVAVLLLALRRQRAGWLPYLAAIVGAIALGVLIEFLQSYQGRPPSLHDVLTDFAGAAAGLALWGLVRRRRRSSSKAIDLGVTSLLIAVALAGVAFIVWPPLQAARAYAHRAAVFPDIARFQAPADLYFIETEGVGAKLVPLASPWRRDPYDRALRITYDNEHAPAVQVTEPSPDWRGYTAVVVDITNPATHALQVTFRIHDANHDWTHEDRFNKPLSIPPQTRAVVRVPLSAIEAAPERRAMDLSRIANVMLFGRVAPGSGELYVSRIWLE